MDNLSISILGCGNIGSAVAKGLVQSGINPNNIILTRRKINQLDQFKKENYIVSDDNYLAIKKSKIIILAVAPGEIMDLLDEVGNKFQKEHLLISLVSGVSIKHLQTKINSKIQIVRAMPNTAAVLKESMTCLASLDEFNNGIKEAQKIFDRIGETIIIDEKQMESATALCACGIAFFLRAIRAASQGGIEIGFHSNEAFTIAAQTARGAAALLLDNSNHPESEIDRVTTPMGATISGLNEIEHRGFSSAMIKGIVKSAEKVSKLFN